MIGGSYDRGVCPFTDFYIIWGTGGTFKRLYGPFEKYYLHKYGKEQNSLKIVMGAFMQNTCYPANFNDML